MDDVAHKPYNSILVFDIETIPQKDLSDTQKAYLQRRLEREEKQGNVPDERLIQSVSPYLGQIAIISILELSSRTKTEVIKTFQPKLIYNGLKYEIDPECGEKAVLQEFWEYIKYYGGMFVSYNGLDFDAPFILNRSRFYGIKMTNRDFTQLRHYSNFPHYDIMQVLANWDKRNFLRLEEACDMFNIESPKEGEVKADGVLDAINSGNIGLVKQYCERDVIATFKLYQRINNEG